MNTRSLLILTPVTLGALALALATAAAPSAPTPADTLTQALRAARAAGSYRVGIEVKQVVRAGGDPDPLFAFARPAGAEVLRYRIDGVARDSATLRLAAKMESPAQADAAVDVLVVDGEAYARAGDAWVRKPGAAPTPGLNGDGLALLALARDVRAQADGSLAFALRSEEVLPWLLRQRGLDEQRIQLALLSQPGLAYGGEGRLTLTPGGLPSRLLLLLAFAAGGAELLHGDPEAADRAIKEGLAASGDPVPFSLAVNLLHIHLFENRLAEAETLARAHLGDKTASGRSFAEVAKSDFDDLAKAGFPVPNRERIETVFAEKPAPQP